MDTDTHDVGLDDLGGNLKGFPGGRGGGGVGKGVDRVFKKLNPFLKLNQLSIYAQR